MSTWYIRQQARTARAEAELWETRSKSFWLRLWWFDFAGTFAKKAAKDWERIAEDWDQIADDIEQAEQRRLNTNV